MNRGAARRAISNREPTAHKRDRRNHRAVAAYKRRVGIGRPADKRDKPARFPTLHRAPRGLAMIEKRVRLAVRREPPGPNEAERERQRRWRRRMVDGDPFSEEQRELVQINSRLEHGELTAEQALAEAGKYGFTLDALSDPAFNPLAVTAWTPLQAILWIATRDLARVRSVSAEARLRKVSWSVVETEPQRRAGRRVVHPGISLKGGEVASPRTKEMESPRLGQSPRLKLDQHAAIARMLGNAEIVKACDELRRRLSDGSELAASGIADEEAPRENIDPSQWLDLRFFRDDIAYRGQVFREHSFAYFSVRLDRERVSSLWPEVEGAGHFDSAELMKLSDAAKVLRINPDTLRKRAERKKVKNRTGQGTYVPRSWVSKQPEFKGWS